MRILTIANCEPIKTLGSGYVISKFARGMARRGHEVRVYGAESCMSFQGLRKGRALQLAFGMWRKAIRLVKEFSPDIIEFYGGEAWLATRQLAARHGRVYRIVAHSNGIEPLVTETMRRYQIHNTIDGQPPRWFQARLRLPVDDAFRRADAVVTVSQAEADYAIARRFQAADRVLAIENAISEELLGRPIRDRRSKIIGFCGSWIPRKGRSVLAAGMTEVLQRAPEWRLQLIGLGNAIRIADYFPAPLHERIEVIPFVESKADLGHLYQNWSIALMPSIYESFGLAGAEAMACGAALVATNTGFCASLEHGCHLLKLEQPSGGLLCDAVMRLIEDEPLRSRIAHGGWSRVQTLRWPENITRLEEFFVALLKAGRQGQKA